MVPSPPAARLCGSRSLTLTPNFRALASRVFRQVGLEVHSANKLERFSMKGLLAQAGHVPIATVFDVGAAYGDWSATCLEHFPNAQYILVEPLSECEPLLAARFANQRTQIVSAAASDQNGVSELRVPADLYGASLLDEPEIEIERRTVTTVRLESVARDLQLEGPYFIKADVQGMELAVLQGAGSLLPSTELILLEVSFFEFLNGAPQFHDVVSYLHGQDFVVFDICNLAYRPLDGALAQGDVLFVKENGELRRSHRYATREQIRNFEERAKPEHAARAVLKE